MMNFREQNQVKWVGTRPGHNGVQVLERNTANNGTTVIYTVPAGKTLYLVNWTLAFFAGGVTGDARMCIWDTTPAIWKFLAFMTVAVNDADNMELSTPFPVEVPAQYTIRVSNFAAGHWTTGLIHGWVE